MAYRYTNTDKWNDAWFINLKKNQKLLFLYLCDNCDVAGFIEINVRRWISDLDMTESEILGAIKGLDRGLIISNSKDCFFIKNFLKHQKNLPLNDKNNAHLGVIKRFEMYKSKFNITNISDFILAPSQPLAWGYGNGKGKGKGKREEEEEEKKEEKTENWRSNYDIYIKELNVAVNTLLNDKDWIKEREKFNPNVNIKLSLEKAYKDFWATDKGWEHKKKSKYDCINWKSTLNSAIELNKVYNQK